MWGANPFLVSIVDGSKIYRQELVVVLVPCGRSFLTFRAVEGFTTLGSSTRIVFVATEEIGCVLTIAVDE